LPIALNHHLTVLTNSFSATEKMDLSVRSFVCPHCQEWHDRSIAFVVSFSQAIAQKFLDTNITSTALCSGAVASGFVAAGDLEGNTLQRRGSKQQTW